MAGHTKGPLTLGKRGMGVIKGGPSHQYTNGSSQSQLFLAMVGQDMSDEERDANADRLINCWNAHDEIVEALQRYLNCDPARDVGGDTQAAQARAALAKAGVE